MGARSDTLCIATKTPGACGACRHANQATVDFAEAHVFCGWGGDGRRPETPCDKPVPLRADVGSTSVETYWLFERYDGENGTWARKQNTRIMAEDASPEMRAAMKADHPFIAGS